MYQSQLCASCPAVWDCNVCVKSTPPASPAFVQAAWSKRVAIEVHSSLLKFVVVRKVSVFEDERSSHSFWSELRELMNFGIRDLLTKHFALERDTSNDWSPITKEIFSRAKRIVWTDQKVSVRNFFFF